MRTCSIPDCELICVCKGFCSKHYYRMKRNGDPLIVKQRGGVTHGKSRSRVYVIWVGMKQRCINKKAAHYDRYGGRGVTYSKSWEKFENFYSDMGDPPDKRTLERINNEGNYSKENCRWVTRKEQSRNMCRNHIVEWKGEKKCLAEWSEITGINANTMHNRILNLGWDADRALSQPSSCELHSNNIMITHNGVTLTMSQWARKIGIKPDTLQARIKYRGWSIEKSLGQPLREYNA